MKLNRVILMMMRHLRNGFEVDRWQGDIVIGENGEITLSGNDAPATFKKNVWVAITGSLLNNGVYKLTQTTENKPLHLANGENDEPATEAEEFSGVVWILSLQREFISLAKEVKIYLESPAGQSTGISSMSESNVGKHKWSAKIATGENGVPLGWHRVFASKLRAGNWREMFETPCIKALKPRQGR